MLAINEQTTELLKRTFAFNKRRDKRNEGGFPSFITTGKHNYRRPGPKSNVFGFCVVRRSTSGQVRELYSAHACWFCNLLAVYKYNIPSVCLAKYLILLRYSYLVLFDVVLWNIVQCFSDQQRKMPGGRPRKQSQAKKGAKVVQKGKKEATNR